MRRVAVEHMLDGAHDGAIPSGPAVALIGLRGPAGGEVFSRSEPHDAVFRVKDRSELGADRNLERIRAGDHDAVLVENRGDGPVLAADEVREYQFGFVLEPEAKTQDAEQ